MSVCSGKCNLLHLYRNWVILREKNTFDFDGIVTSPRECCVTSVPDESITYGIIYPVMRRPIIRIMQTRLFNIMILLVKNGIIMSA